MGMEQVGPRITEVFTEQVGPTRMDSYAKAVHFVRDNLFIPGSYWVPIVNCFSEGAHFIVSAVNAVAMGVLGLVSLTPYVSAKLGLNNHNFRKGCSDLFVLSIADMFRSALCCLPGANYIAKRV